MFLTGFVVPRPFEDLVGYLRVAGDGVGVVLENGLLDFIGCDICEGEVIIVPGGGVWVEVVG